MNWWWYAARAFGLVAWVLAAASVLWGLLLSSRALSTMTRQGGTRPPIAPWLLDLHGYLGSLTALFTAGHLVALLGDSYVQFDLVDIVVPMTSPWHPVAVTWGVLALWCLVAVLGSSWLRRWLPPAWWRRAHWVSFPVAVLSTVHAFTAGTDRHHPLAIGTGVLLGLATTVLLLVRMLGPRGQVGRGGAPVRPRRPVP